MNRMDFARVAGALALAAPALAEDFAWRGHLTAGQTLQVRGVNGAITVEPSEGDVEVTAVKRSIHSDPDAVEVRTTLPQAGGITICALYPTPWGRGNACSRGVGSARSPNHDVEVDFTVKLPPGVKLRAHTIDGPVRVRDVDSDVYVSSVNGSIEIAASGQVKADTSNGSIEARMSHADWTGHLDLETLNGTIALAVPHGIGAELEAKRRNGAPSAPPGDLQRVRLKTVNGRITFDGALQRHASLDVQSVRGSVELCLPADTDSSVTAHTFSGTIRNAWDAEVRKPETGGREMTFTAGSGGAAVDVQVVTGDVIVAKH